MIRTTMRQKLLCRLGNLTGSRPVSSANNIFSHFRLHQSSINFVAEQFEANLLVEWVSRSAALLQKFGVNPGDRVAAQVDKSVLNVVLYLATMKIGAVYVPLNIDYKLAEVEYLINDAKPQLLLAQSHLDDDSVVRLSSYVAELVKIGDFGRLMSSTVPLAESYVAPMEPDSPAALVYTSGTTGKPKGATITHRNLIFNSQTLAKFWHFSNDDVLLHALPLYHVHGLFVALNTALMVGCHVNLLPKFSPQAVMQYLPSSSVMMGIPTYYTRLLSHKSFAQDSIGSRMRVFVSGSAPLSAQSWHEFKKRSGYAIRKFNQSKLFERMKIVLFGTLSVERYGLTECQMVCSNPYFGLRKPGTVGVPLPGVSVRLNERNVLEVKGENVFKGYWKMPEKTRQEFASDGYFVTGDTAAVDSDGYITIMGREKDLIITGGLNVYPKEVELQIDTLAGVKVSQLDF